VTPSWTCTTCQVTTRYTDPSRVDPPAGWTEDHGSWRCLACGRAHAVSLALAAAGVDPDAGKPATAIRHRALAEFELRRDPDRPDSMIAKPISVPATAIREARAELLASGAIQARLPGAATAGVGSARPSRNPGAGHRVEAELRRDPHRSNVAIAQAARAGDQTVSRLRRRLEDAGEIERRQ